MVGWMVGSQIRQISKKYGKLLLLAFFFYFLARITNCGRFNTEPSRSTKGSDGTKIVGGTDSQEGSWPFMMSFHDAWVDYTESPLDAHVCSAAVVAPHFAVTSATCAQKYVYTGCIIHELPFPILWKPKAFLTKLLHISISSC